MELLAALSLLIGLLLGLLGGGGSILTVPMLVYLGGIEPKAAVTTSLVVVGITSVAAMLQHARAGRVCWKNGAVFGIAAMVGGYGGGIAAARIPGDLLLLLFAAFMLLTGAALLRGRAESRSLAYTFQRLCPSHLPMLRILGLGLLVGAFAGLVGAGGGFLVVPALNLLGGLPMHAAVGTSLLVIALQSGAALAGYASHVQIDWLLAGGMSAAAIVGSLVGGALSRHINAAVLRRAFGIFVIAVACYVMQRELQVDWGSFMATNQTALIVLCVLGLFWVSIRARVKTVWVDFGITYDEEDAMKHAFHLRREISLALLFKIAALIGLWQLIGHARDVKPQQTIEQRLFLPSQTSARGSLDQEISHVR